MHKSLGILNVLMRFVLIPLNRKPGNLFSTLESQLNASQFLTLQNHNKYFIFVLFLIKL